MKYKFFLLSNGQRKHRTQWSSITHQFHFNHLSLNPITKSLFVIISLLHAKLENKILLKALDRTKLMKHILLWGVNICIVLLCNQISGFFYWYWASKTLWKSYQKWKLWNLKTLRWIPFYMKSFLQIYSVFVLIHTFIKFTNMVKGRV